MRMLESWEKYVCLFDRALVPWIHAVLFCSLSIYDVVVVCFFFTWHFITWLKPQFLQYKSYIYGVMCWLWGFVHVDWVTIWQMGSERDNVLSCCRYISPIPMSSLYLSYLSSHILGFSGQWSAILACRCYFWRSSKVLGLCLWPEGREFKSKDCLSASAERDDS